MCPSHFLSTRLQVRPLNRFFTIDSLKDADLRKDVPYSVSLASHVSTHLRIHLSAHLYYHHHSNHPSHLHFLLQAQNLPFQQILPTLDFFTYRTAFMTTGLDRTYHMLIVLFLVSHINFFLFRVVD